MRPASTEASRAKNKVYFQKRGDAERGDKGRSAKGNLRTDDEEALLAIYQHSTDAVLFPADVPILSYLDGLISPHIEGVAHSIKSLGNFGNHPNVSHFDSETTRKDATKVVASMYHFQVDDATKTTATKHVLFVADSYVTAAEVLFRSMPITKDSGGKPVTRKVMRKRVLNACDSDTGLSSFFKGDRLSFIRLDQFEEVEAAAEAEAKEEAEKNPRAQ